MDISWLALGLFMLVLIVPFAINRSYQLHLGKEISIAVVRMTLQMALIGLYLQYLFHLDNVWVNLAWLLVMLLVGASAIISKAKLPKRPLMVPICTGLLLGLMPILMVMMLWLFQPTPIYSAQYLIPTAGMLLGNSLSGNIIALQRLFAAFEEKQPQYHGALALGASPKQAAAPFVQTALQQSFAPILASMATTGLVSLPGMMTGQILGGVDPIIAVKYQIVILVAIFATLTISVATSVSLTVRKLLTHSGKMRFNTHL
ncbi:ABC transporter permease [Shewanella sp. 1_MG-2023]|uniref:ABC transporter permease n=1 Tax=unclassified Shewanella TaxID=196818 RepID=UPI0026E13CA9|nr:MULTISPECIES: ABC transporter permease [unclassified Shewanella]MDO6610643.1 ABC transporter permease [Shewanella sp. 7_MG-2023]MDO6770768.1 ABC transporter permease [Shewanella sp. 2_MG-2023]MDO6793214.1 ABC transporter permease [Shewanella sp. 1_MG-2023]